MWVREIDCNNKRVQEWTLSGNYNLIMAFTSIKLANSHVHRIILQNMKHSKKESMCTVH